VTVGELRKKIRGMKPGVLVIFAGEGRVYFENPPSAKSPWPKKESHKRVLELHAEGLGSTCIARQVGISKQAVNDVLRRAKQKEAQRGEG
jgi:DNA-binding NarL/FixJ family response regulator